MSDKRCTICDDLLRLRWTDTHGVSACTTCCSPYRSYKYNDKNERSIVCESLTKEQYVPLMRRYWAETKCKIPHSFDMGISSYENQSYSGLTEKDFDAFDKWMKKNDPNI